MRPTSPLRRMTGRGGVCPCVARNNHDHGDGGRDQRQLDDEYPALLRVVRHHVRAN
jgi:hypothetical protein